MIKMGTYYRIVCAKHKEVLDLSKAYELNNELRDFISEHDLTRLIFDGVIHLNEKLRLICKNHYSHERLNRNMQSFMDRHMNCKLTFQSDEPHDEELREEDGWEWIDLFEAIVI